MGKIKMTVSLPEEIAGYLRSKKNASAVIGEAVGIYRARELERELEEAYKSDAEESARLNQHWESLDEDIPE